jgi:hypothetical protein
MHVEMRRDVQIDPTEERQHVLGGVSLPQPVQHLAGPDVQRGEQIDRAVTLVVMGHRVRATRLERQRRLRTVQRLALGLLVEAEHRGPVGRIQIQTRLSYFNDEPL